MKKYLIFYILIIILPSCGSPPKNPSVRDTVKKSVSDSLSLGLKEYRSGNLKSAVSYFEEALRGAYSIDDNPRVIDASQKLSELYIRTSNYTAASNYIFNAKYLCERENLTSFNFIIYLTIGKFYEKSIDTPEGYKMALSNYIRASDSSLDKVERAIAYNNIGIAEKKLRNLDEALSWFEKARDINEASRIYDALGDNYYYLGGVMEEKGNYEMALTNYFSALNYDKISEKSTAILDDLKSIGGIYFKLGKNDDSLFYYMKSLKTAESINDAGEIDSISNSLKYLQKH
jgi:tetratricopeptide (TPR) repeat protein